MIWRVTSTFCPLNWTFFGGGEGTRTLGLYIANVALYAELHPRVGHRIVGSLLFPECPGDLSGRALEARGFTVQRLTAWGTS